LVLPRDAGCPYRLRMTTSTQPDTNPTTRPAPLRAGDDRFVPLAAELGARFAERADEHDRENTFVGENYELLADAGYLRLAVPEDLGGLGASLRQVCYAQAELARSCGSTALAANMHVYITLVQCFRRRLGMDGAEAVLRRVAEEDLVLFTSGGSDWLWSNGTAVRDDGGYRVSGRKAFCSQAPRGDVLVTTAIAEDGAGEREVLLFTVPTAADGVSMLETWDTLGMRGTASHDIELDDVFVAEAQIVGRRAWGKFDPPLMAAAIHFMPTVASVYYGIAAGARDEAVRLITGKRRGNDPMETLALVHRQVGLMDYQLRTSWWALMASLDEIGDDYGADAVTMNTLSLAKRKVVTDAVEVVDVAMETAGGMSFYNRTSLPRAYRDVRAGKYHPLTPEASLFYAGRLALGGPTDTE
jgi:alkylation response protein AidB-like acyl-CoA dehydrogenase